MNLDTRSQLSHATVVLHWLVALAVIAMLALGIYMAETETRSLYPLHKSFGVLVFLLVIVRVAWRMKNGWLEPVGDYPRRERVLAKAVHYLLLIGTVLMPLSGFLMSALGGTGVAVFGLELVARNPDPANPARVLAHNAEAAAFFRGMHGAVAFILIVAIGLHIAGSLKHHLVDKDGTLKRIFGARV
jgi:cytochrome b561